MVVRVVLHTTLQLQTPEGPVGSLELTLLEDARVADAIAASGVQVDLEHTLLVVNRQIVEAEHLLNDGDQLDLIPAMSGG